MNSKVCIVVKRYKSMYTSVESAGATKHQQLPYKKNHHYLVKYREESVDFFRLRDAHFTDFF